MAKFNKNVYPGAKFGDVVVIDRILGSGGKVLCRCKCGKTFTPGIPALVSGRSRSCGCGRLAKPGVGYGKVVPGAVFNRLTVVEHLPNKASKRPRRKALCRCICGNSIEVTFDALVRNNTKSCGCLSSETTAKRNKDTARHKGFSSKYPRTWIRWSGMIGRCYRKGSNGYKDYGAVGVRVCKNLQESPWNLMKLIGPVKNAKPSLDRHPIHNGNYTCGRCDECKANGWVLNVRWASRKEQSNNRGDFNVYLTAFGKTLTRSQWQDLTGLNETRINRRIKELGWSVEKALTTPDKKGNCYRPETS